MKMNKDNKKKYNENQSIFKETIIVGGGASGLMLASQVGNENTLILEKRDKLGSKILASGNGRCNLTNLEISNSDEILEAFQNMGLFTKDINSWVYPLSEDAKDVVRILKYKLEQNGVEVEFNEAVEKIIVVKQAENFRDMEDINPQILKDVTSQCVKDINSQTLKDINFLVATDKKNFYCKTLVLATGGKSMSKLGTTGDGYKFARNLGHSIKPLIPVLTAIETKEDMEKLSLIGIRQKVKVDLRYKADLVASESGEIQFTKYGLSGICIFNISRYMMLPKDKNLKNGFDDYEISIDLIPEFTFDKLYDIFDKRLSDDLIYKDETWSSQINDCKEIENIVQRLLCSFMKFDIAVQISKKVIKDIVDNRIVSKADFINLIIANAKEFILNPKGVKGWEFAQVTKGGVSLDEINLEAMQSKIVPNLYFAGEIIDFDGACGGYNLHNAWDTGLKVAKALKQI